MQVYNRSLINYNHAKNLLLYLFLFAFLIITSKYFVGNVYTTSLLLIFIILLVGFTKIGFSIFPILFISFWFFQRFFPFKIIFLGSMKVLPGDIFFGFMVLGYFLDIILNNVNPFKNKIDKLMGFLFLLCTINLFRGLPIYTYQAIGEGRSIAFMFFYFSARRYFKNIEFLKYILILLLTRASFSIWMGINYYLNTTYDDFVFQKGQDITFFHVLGGWDSIIIILAVTFLLMNYRESLKLLKRFSILFVPIAIIMVFLAQVRTNYIAIAGGLFAYLFLSKRRLSPILKLLVFVIGIYFVVKIMLPEGILDSVGKSVVSVYQYNSDVNAQWRLEKTHLEISSVFNADWHIKLFGFPFGRWFLANDIGFYNVGLSTHNTFIDLFTKVGIIGIFILFLVYFRVYRLMRRIKMYISKYEKMLFILLSIVSAHLITYPGLQNYNTSIIFGFVLGLLINRIEKIKL